MKFACVSGRNPSSGLQKNLCGVKLQSNTLEILSTLGRAPAIISDSTEIVIIRVNPANISESLGKLETDPCRPTRNKTKPLKDIIPPIDNGISVVTTRKVCNFVKFPMHDEISSVRVVLEGSRYFNLTRLHMELGN